jgi:hypothetical protein
MGGELHDPLVQILAEVRHFLGKRFRRAGT